jgi:triosephosphate isomerase
MQTHTPFIAGNWKMYKTSSEARETAARLVDLVADVDDVDIMIAPTFTALESVSAVTKDSRVSLGAQNLFWEKEGAYTGQISAAMLVDAGCQYVIIGHSERRQYFGETDETVNKKLRAAIAAGLKPVVCVGETDAERESGQTFSVLDKQIKFGLNECFVDDLSDLVIAYEPVWAIGTGKTLRILYGGSVKPANTSALMAMADIDGALVGGASLDPESFSQIVHFK